MSDELRLLAREEEHPVGELLSAQLDGQLTPAEEAELQAALASDPALRVRQEELQALQRKLEGALSASAPTHLLPGLLVELRAAEASGLGKLLQRLVERWDARVGDRLRKTGSLRLGKRDRHGQLAVAGGLLLAALPLLGNLTMGLSAIPAVGFLWLATLGVDRRYRASAVLAAGALAAALPIALEASALTPPLALPAAIAAIAVLQWGASRAEGQAFVRAGVLTGAAALCARPDICGAQSVIPLLCGAIAGGGAALLARPRPLADLDGLDLADPADLDQLGPSQLAEDLERF